MPVMKKSEVLIEVQTYPHFFLIFYSNNKCQSAAPPTKIVYIIYLSSFVEGFNTAKLQSKTTLYFDALQLQHQSVEDFSCSDYCFLYWNLSKSAFSIIIIFLIYHFANRIQRTFGLETARK